jgi:hypothetical protein
MPARIRVIAALAMPVSHRTPVEDRIENGSKLPLRARTGHE